MAALRPGHLEAPHPSRLDPEHPRLAAVLTAHAAAVAAGQGQYRDPISGWPVMTAPALVAQGHCCTNGCRHCPYDTVDGGPG